MYNPNILSNNIIEKKTSSCSNNLSYIKTSTSKQILEGDNATLI